MVLRNVQSSGMIILRKGTESSSSECPAYEIAGKYNIEMYTDASKYPKGTADENYYSEIWIPVKTK